MGIPHSHPEKKLLVEGQTDKYFIAELWKKRTGTDAVKHFSIHDCGGKQAAEMLGLAPQTLAKWAMTGKNLPVVKLGNRTARYLLSDVMSFIAISTNGHSGNYASNAG